MIRSLLTALLTLSSIASNAQNLVPNPSFEDYSTCPIGQNQVSFAIDWFGFGDSPDYFNSCSGNSDFQVPFNWGGYQQDEWGSGYCAFGAYTSPIYGASNVRDFVGVQLNQTLTIGTKYYVSFRVSLSLSSTIWANCACDSLGVLFSVNQPSWSHGSPLPNFVHVGSVNVVDDSLDWVLVSGAFVSDSAYQYLGIGNFFEDIRTDTLIMESDPNCKFSYYYLDDVCVSTDSIYCSNFPFSNLSENHDNKISIYPNPTVSTVMVEISQYMGPYEVSIFNSLGDCIFKKANIQTPNFAVDLEHVSSGVLHLMIKQDHRTSIHQIVKK